MDLPFQTPVQFIALGITLLAGWFFGLASAPGGRRWRERYDDEALDHASYRTQAENDLKEAKRRIRELETENERLRKDVAPGSAAALATVPVAESTMPAAQGWRGWFGWGRDNLARIRGIDEARERRLNELGIKTYLEIEKMTADDEASLEDKLGLAKGEIAKEGWREQAALLRAGNEDEHATRFG